MKVSTFISFKDVVYIGILTAFFSFLSFILYVRTEPTPIYGVFDLHYGFPLEWLTVTSLVGGTGFKERIRIEYAALFLDVFLYFLLSIIIVYLVMRLKTH